MALAIRVKKEKAEEVRKLLLKLNLIDSTHLPSSNDDFIFFPIKKSIDEKTKQDIAKKFDANFLEKKMKRKLIQKFSLPPFDMIGDIVIFEIPKEFKDKEETEKIKAAREIAENILKQHKNVRLVAMKTGGVSGPYRIRKFDVILSRGDNSTITIHKEHGCRFKIDVAKAYYSPRLSYERRRINSLANDGETVFVPFAGVGPFAIIIAKSHPKSTVYANELNPDAYKYLEENIRLNKLSNVIPIPGDARDLTEKYSNKADRVIMPLPMSSDQFLDVAFSLAKKNCIVHFYYFTNSISAAEDVVKEAAKRFNRKIKILESRMVRDYSPEIIEVVVDFKILD
jgi:tRNA (guanine37-N1)-methyltransferase